MLRRVHTALFEAPAGARIEIVVESQGNNGVNDARFEYAGRVLPRETILGLPGCSFTVENTSRILEAVVVFDTAAPGTARYDMFEVENGVKSDLQKSTRHSQSVPQIGFAIDPLPVAAVAVGMASGVRRAAPPARATAATAGKAKAVKKAKKVTKAKRTKPPKTKAPASKKKTVKRKKVGRKGTRS
jgi:hypothetical protein